MKQLLLHYLPERSLRGSLRVRKQSKELSNSGRMSPEIHYSARKHYRRDRLSDDAVLFAVKHVLFSYPLDVEDSTTLKTYDA